MKFKEFCLLAEAEESEETPMLLSEQWDGGLSVSTVLNESSGVEYTELSGVIGQSGVKNRNGRIYPRAVLKQAVQDYLREHQGKLMLGELSHPPRANVDPLQACIAFKDVWFNEDDGNVYAKATILSGDGGVGDKLKKYLEAGWLPGISTRGLGSLTERAGCKYVNEGFKITCLGDIVLNNSAPAAILTVN